MRDSQYICSLSTVKQMTYRIFSVSNSIILPNVTQKNNFLLMIIVLINEKWLNVCKK